MQSYINDNTAKSELKTVTCGVPRVSALGPLLFIICITDLPNSLKDCKYCLLLILHQLYMHHFLHSELSNHLNTDLEFLAQWIRATEPLKGHGDKMKIFHVRT